MRTQQFIALCFMLLFAGCTGAPQRAATPPMPTTVDAVSFQAAPTATRTRLPTATRTPTAGPTATRRPTATPTRTRVPPTATRALPTATRAQATATRALATATARPAANGSIVVNRQSVALFDRIPEQYLTAARNLRMVWMDQSVGQNINEALDCLAAPSWGQSKALCRRDYTQVTGSQWLWKTFTGADLQAGIVPAQIQFQPDPNRYNRSNWTYVTQQGSWEEYLAAFFTTHAPAAISQKDVISFQFTYLHVSAGSTIASDQEGFLIDQPHTGFYNNRERWDISDLRELQAANPNKVFIYWTTSLSRAIGTDASTAFNDRMRQYAAANGMPLFDAADILSHDPDGRPCYDNRDGVEYCNTNGCENHPNDNRDNLAICQAYTTEIDGGHLGSVSGARVQLAKAYWVLMAQIAGWRP